MNWLSDLLGGLFGSSNRELTVEKRKSSSLLEELAKCRSDLSSQITEKERLLISTKQDLSIEQTRLEELKTLSKNNTIALNTRIDMLLSEKEVLKGESYKLKAQLAECIDKLSLVQPEVDIAILSPVEKSRKWWSLSEKIRPPANAYAPDWDIEAILPLFDKSKEARIRDLPLVRDSSVMTARAQTLREEGSVDKAKVLVSIVWSTFHSSFKYDLLVHEILHILEPEAGIDIAQFYNDVQGWYKDNSYGMADQSSNYIKYILKFQLYSGTQPQYSDTTLGVEEFAYIGTFLAKDSKYSKEVSALVKGYYDGILEGLS